MPIIKIGDDNVVDNAAHGLSELILASRRAREGRPDDLIAILHPSPAELATLVLRYAATRGRRALNATL